MLVSSGEGLIIGDHSSLFFNNATLRYRDIEVWKEDLLQWTIPPLVDKLFFWVKNGEEHFFILTGEKIVEKVENFHLMGETKENKED